MPFWYHTLVIMLGCALLVLQGSVIKAYCQAVKAYGQLIRWKELRWLEKLAEEHTATMKHLVRILHHEFPATAHFSDTNQFVVLRIPIVNRSIYTLTLQAVEQHFTFEGEQLPDPPRIEWTPNLHQVTTAKNTALFTIEIAQKISPLIAECIQSQGEGTFGAHKVSIKFSYRDYTDTPQTVNVNLGGPISFSLTAN